MKDLTTIKESLESCKEGFNDVYRVNGTDQNHAVRVDALADILQSLTQNMIDLVEIIKAKGIIDGV